MVLNDVQRHRQRHAVPGNHFFCEYLYAPDGVDRRASRPEAALPVVPTRYPPRHVSFQIGGDDSVT